MIQYSDRKSEGIIYLPHPHGISAGKIIIDRDDMDPCPLIAFKYTGNVATRVFPSPVFISAIFPLCRIIPPIIWTSKCLWPKVLFAASRTEAKASGRISSKLSPSAILDLNSKSFRFQFLIIQLCQVRLQKSR